MAKPSLEIISVLRATAQQLSKSSTYQWGHMGACNCGHLAQQVTRLSQTEIHRRALISHGDWTEQLNDYCPASGLPLDDVISELIAFGFDSDDLRHLERLSDARVLQQLPQAKRNLAHNKKEDAVVYLQAWANLVEEEMLSALKLPSWQAEPIAG